jgi:hypothetical protein
MLQNEHEEVQWEKVIMEANDKLPKDLKPYIISGTEVTEINFPVLQYPEKVKSLNLEKENKFSGLLKGIKGQYLLFEDQTVYNIRSNEGTRVTIEID